MTGSLNAAAANGCSRPAALSALRAAQGTAMGRRGRILITSEADRVWVGGRTDIVLSGTAAL